jgi:hypothetical protein
LSPNPGRRHHRHYQRRPEEAPSVHEPGNNDIRRRDDGRRFPYESLVVDNRKIGHERNNNTFTWSGPNGVVGFTGQWRVTPPSGELHVKATRAPQEKVCLVVLSILNSNLRLLATYPEAVCLVDSSVLNRDPRLVATYQSLRSRARTRIGSSRACTRTRPEEEPPRKGRRPGTARGSG